MCIVLFALILTQDAELRTVRGRVNRSKPGVGQEEHWHSEHQLGVEGEWSTDNQRVKRGAGTCCLVLYFLLLYCFLLSISWLSVAVDLNFPLRQYRAQETLLIFSIFGWGWMDG